ncbi:DsrE family protein [Nocardioides sp. GY 10127]|uniref:DsrE family protein n=1 Tax=Nocardioides sp. GY 10127 TaxID=2569762 RepID=UPI0010A8053B|nr:DsrE family protein [Nocardioides sp. GY 10127]TIC79432.1 sulfur reduction protein DsrE [Nocardioides sp. GY 10127]
MRPLVLKVTAGADAPERANQGLTVAAAAAASGAQVSLWLTGESAWWGTPDHGRSLDLPHATDVDELIGLVRELGTVTVCGQCAARRSIGEADTLPGVRIAGAAVFAEEVLADGVQALVY